MPTPGDAWNRPVKVELPGEPPTLVGEYRYDGLGRRIAKLVREDDGEWTRTDYYYNNRWQVVEERLARDLNDTAKETPASAVYAEYIWGAGYVDTPICRFRDADESGGTLEETLYYLTDANHNVTALMTPAGEVVERYAYDAYGQVLVLNGADSGSAEWSLDSDGRSDWGNDILYAGYRLDGETGLYHVRRRVYHPTLGRWLTRDPQGYADGMNLYQYCQSDPLGATDPMGLGTGPTSRPVQIDIDCYLGPDYDGRTWGWDYDFRSDVLTVRFHDNNEVKTFAKDSPQQRAFKKAYDDYVASLPAKKRALEARDAALLAEKIAATPLLSGPAAWTALSQSTKPLVWQRSKATIKNAAGTFSLDLLETTTSTKADSFASTYGSVQRIKVAFEPSDQVKAMCGLNATYGVLAFCELQTNSSLPLAINTSEERAARKNKDLSHLAIWWKGQAGAWTYPVPAFRNRTVTSGMGWGDGSPTMLHSGYTANRMSFTFQPQRLLSRKLDRHIIAFTCESGPMKGAILGCIYVGLRATKEIPARASLTGDAAGTTYEWVFLPPQVGQLIPVLIPPGYKNAKTGALK